MFTEKSPWVFGLLLPIALSAILISLSVAHGDDNDDAADSTQPPAMTAPAQNAEAEQLAVFTQINQEYQGVKHILEYSCFDCHSTQTDYPWYHSIPGLKQWMDGHIEHGLHHLDLTNDFPFPGRSQAHKLEEIKEQIEAGEMPIFSYRIMHWGRMIENEKRDTLFQWIDSSIARLERLESNAAPTTPEESEESGE